MVEQLVKAVGLLIDYSTDLQDVNHILPLNLVDMVAYGGKDYMLCI